MPVLQHIYLTCSDFSKLDCDLDINIRAERSNIV